MVEKTCKKCGYVGPTEDFVLGDKYTRVDGTTVQYRENVCKTCHNARNRKRYIDNNEREQIVLRKRQNRAAKPDQYREADRKRYRKRSAENIEHARAYQREYRQNKMKTDVQFRLRMNIASRISHAVTRKTQGTIKLLGCTVDFYVLYLEEQFTEGMTWDNYGAVWHIDHIIPCSHFDLTTEEGQQKAFHYTNTQPMLAFDNLSKGNRL